MKNLRVPVSENVSLNVRYHPARGSRDAARPFVLLHGLLSNARVWDEVAERLSAAGHPVYAVDQRGHGDSDVPVEGYENATIASDLVHAAAALELTDAIWVGHSWGAHLALRLSAEHPELVAALAMVDGGWYEFDGPLMRSFWKRTAHVVRKAQEGVIRAADMRAYLKASHPEWSATAIEARLADYRISPEGMLTPRLDETQVISIVDSLLRESPSDWHPKITVPVLLLPVLPPLPQLTDQVRTWVADTEQALARAHVRWYPGSDHDLHAGAPDELARDLRQLALETAASS